MLSRRHPDRLIAARLGNAGGVAIGYGAGEMYIASDVPAILRGLSNVADKRQVLVQGGGPPEGDPCGALHWHGYVGQEAQVVGTIADWIDAHPPR